MLEAFKTPTGAYNLTLIISGIIWLLAGIGIIAGFNVNRVKAIEAQQKTREAQAAQKEANDMLQAAQKRLANAEAEITKLRPKPLKFRLRDLLEQIDPKIIPAVKLGRFGFEGGVTPPQYDDLLRLAREPGAEQFITVDPDVKTGIGTGPGGSNTYRVKFKVTPSLVQN